MFDFTSMQDATENCHYLELVRKPLRHELNFIFPLDYVTQLIVLGERASSVAVDKFGVVEKNILIQNCFSAANKVRYPATQISVL